MKKYLSMMVAMMMAGSLCACGNGEAAAANNNTSANTNASANSENTSDGDKLQIVTTIFPEYDWVMNVIGENSDNAEVTMLLDNGVDLHSYQPTADDILKISTCDLFIYVGGESDEWVDDALKEATNKDMVVIDLLDVLGESVKEEEVVEGMQGEDEHEEGEEEAHEEHEDEEEGHEHEEGEVEYDEHVWLSLKNTAVLVENISESLQTIDSDNAQTYSDNAAAYVEKLNELDSKFAETVENAATKTVLFGDRFPFRYLVDDYGLEYYAAFVGCSAETEASFETITFLSQKVDELGLPVVLTIEGDNHKIAETIVSNTQTKDQEILTMDSMQSTTSEDVQNGASYLSIMESNLEVLTQALN